MWIFSEFYYSIIIAIEIIYKQSSWIWWYDKFIVMKTQWKEKIAFLNWLIIKFILQCLKEEYSVQYSNIVSIYFSQSGISSKSYNDICMLENMQISNELNLGLVYRPIPYWKKLIKNSFFFSVMDKIRKIIFQNGKKHRCQNNWCRWCRGK